MRETEAKVGLQRFQQSFVAYFILALSLTVTLFFSLYVYRSVRARDQARFNASVQDLTTYLRGRPRLYVEVLRAATGLFAVNPNLQPKAFHKFVERLELAEQYPGAGGIGFLGRVKQGDQQSYIATMRQQGLQDFQISPDNGQAESFPIIYFESLDKRSKLPTGFDLVTNPVLSVALANARDTAMPTASGRLSAGSPGNDLPGFFIFVPIYRHDETPQSVAERRDTLSGFVYTRFRTADLIDSILATKDFGAVDMKVYDGTLPTPANLLHDTTPEALKSAVNSTSRLQSSAGIDVAGRNWLVIFAARPDFFSSNLSVYYILLSGLLTSLVLFVLVRFQVLARGAAELAAAELRVSEGKVRQTLRDHERAEIALRESEERYRELVENASDIIYTLDLDSRVTSINKACETICGYTREEMLGMNLAELLTPGSLTAGQEMLERKLIGEERTNYEVDAIAKNGSVITLEISSRLVSQNGKPLGIQGVARDITKRRRAEEALREADHRALSEYERLLVRIASLAQSLGTARDLQAIYGGLREFSLASVPCDGFFVSLYDPLREVRTASYGWGDGQEFDVSELPPMPITAEGPNSRAIRTGEIIVTEDYMNTARVHPVVIVGPENGLRPQCSLVAPMAVMGRIIGTVEVQSYIRAAYREEHVTAMRMAANLTAVAIENTRLLDQESNARAAAEESNRLKDEFLATVSHELRTPLTAILGWSRMLETGLDPETATRAIETIWRNARSQSQIIDDILDVSRIITGNLYLELQPLELGPIIEAAMNVVRPTADAKGIVMETQLDSQPTMVPGDASRLQQVFWNLLSNAIKFAPAAGLVKISITNAEGYAEITVQDNGQGITPEFLPFVFDRFRQADSTTTRRHGGLGLGLAIVRHLVEIHGGSVAAESAGTGKGAKFTVRLPVVNAPNWQGSTPNMFEILEQQSVRALSGLQVLVVDDDADTLEVIAAALTGGAAKVTVAPSVADAMERIKESRPDVIVSDIAMPIQDGYALITQVRALDNGELPEIPAVAITAYARNEDRERALSAGYQQYLAKPIEPLELIAILAKLVGRADASGNGKVN